MITVYEKQCPNCGTTFTGTKRQMFCGHICANRYRRANGGDYDKTLEWNRSNTDLTKWQCAYNSQVECHSRRCRKCGWNPEVAKARLEAIMGKSSGEDGK